MCSQSRHAGLQKTLAIEIGAHSHFDAFDVAHENKAGRILADTAQEGANVPAIVQTSHEAFQRTIELNDTAGRFTVKKCEGVGCIGKFLNRADRKAQAPKHALRIGAVIFEPVAIGAAPDDVQSLLPHCVLKSPTLLGRVFKQNDFFRAHLPNPGDLVAPVIHMPD